MQIQAAHINPFLQSATLVLEQMCAVSPQRGNISVTMIEYRDDYVWLKIGVVGQMKGNVVFGFPQQVALKIVSGMMGGYTISELDEMGLSAISELGNMISGNASSIMYNEGIAIDITPPELIKGPEQKDVIRSKAVAVSLVMEQIGEFEIYVATLNG